MKRTLEQLALAMMTYFDHERGSHFHFYKGSCGNCGRTVIERVRRA